MLSDQELQAIRARCNSLKPSSTLPTPKLPPGFDDGVVLMEYVDWIRAQLLAIMAKEQHPGYRSSNLRGDIASILTGQAVAPPLP